MTDAVVRQSACRSRWSGAAASFGRRTPAPARTGFTDGRAAVLPQSLHRRRPRIGTSFAACRYAALAERRRDTRRRHGRSPDDGPRARNDADDDHRRLRSSALRTLLVIAIVLALKVASPLLLPIVAACVLTFALAPTVRALRRRGVPEALGAAMVVASLLAITLLVGSTLVGPASQWWERAPQTVAQVLAQIERLGASIMRRPQPSMSTRPNSPAAAASAAAPAPSDPLKDKLATEGVSFTRVLIAHLLSFTLSAAATVILLYFLLASEHWMLSRSVEAIPRPRSRALVVAGVRAAEREIGRFVATLALINVGVAAITGFAVWLLGMPNPVLWGAVAGTLNFIPYFGPMVTVALLALAGTLSFDTASAMLAPALAYLFIHAIESNLVSPWFIGRRLTLAPLAVFLSVMFWGWLWGLAGAMLAVPVLVGVRSVCKRQRRLRLLGAYLEGDHRPVPSLHSLLMGKRRVQRPDSAS
jgi:predicted PurR-regulated permease PerM